MYTQYVLLLFQVVILLIILFLKEKMKNAATIEDIRTITTEEQKGRLEVEAAKDTMASIARADALIEKLALRMCLEAISERDQFVPANYGLAVFDLWSELASTLDKNYIMLPDAARSEIDYFKGQWPHFLGGKKFKWVRATLSTVFIKNAALKVFRRRMSLHLDLYSSAATSRPFDKQEVDEEYKIANLNEFSGRANSDLVLNLIACGLSIENVRELFPDQTFLFKDAEGKAVKLE